MTSATKPRILHLTGDFPDPIVTAKTPVIERLLALTAQDFDHQVVSINRRSPSLFEWPRAMLGVGAGPTTQAFEKGVALEYRAPGSGLLHTVFLDWLGDWLAGYVETAGRPDLLVAHKLTIEGLAVQRASAKLGIPYAVAIQGKTDLRAIEARPDLRDRFRRVLNGAKAVSAMAPWTLEAVQRQLGNIATPTATIPCPLASETPRLEPAAGKAHFLSAFHLRNHRTKNLEGMARALKQLRRAHPETRLRVAGGGSIADWKAAKSAAAASSGIDFLDHQNAPQLGALMNDSVALLLPSRRESFGLVFVEALFAGLPIIYPAGSGVDGYFDDRSFALRANARDPGSIARAMQFAMENEAAIKRDLAEWQKSQHARQFEREAISTEYSKLLRRAVDA